MSQVPHQPAPSSRALRAAPPAPAHGDLPALATKHYVASVRRGVRPALPLTLVVVLESAAWRARFLPGPHPTIDDEGVDIGGAREWRAATAEGAVNRARSYLISLECSLPGNP